MKFHANWFGKIASLALLTAASSSCTHNAQPVRVSMQALPPLSGKIKIETTIVPRSQKFKVAVLTFIDQTGRAQLVVDPIADMLTTELFMVKRFELYDRQDLVEQTHARSYAQEQTVAAAPPADPRAPDQAAALQYKKDVAEEAARRMRDLGAADQKTAQQYKASQGKVDGILLGYITSFKMTDVPPPPPPVETAPRKKGAKEDPKAAAPPAPIAARDTEGSGEFELDFRIVNTLAAANRASEQADRKIEGLKELVVFGDSAKVKFRMKGGSIELDRGDVAKIAAGVKAKFPEFSDRKITITSLQDRMVSLTVRESDGVKQGFTGYVVKQDPNTHIYRYLAEFVVINVFREGATAVVVPPEEPATLADVLGNISVGSEALIK